MTQPIDSRPPLPAREVLSARVREELSALFDVNVPATLVETPACIDVIGGLLAGHGGAICVMPVDLHTHVLVQPRNDRQLVIFDFDEYDEKRPFTLQMSLEALFAAPEAELKRNLAEPGRRFAAPVIAAVLSLRKHRLFDSETPLARGFNLAVQRDEDVSPLATILATTLTLTDDSKIERSTMIELCRDASAFVGERSATEVEVVAMVAGQAMLRQAVRVDRQSQALSLPDDVCLVALSVEGTIAEEIRDRVDVAARMAHRLILEKMRDFGQQAGRELISDPMAGQLGNLAMNDYKRFFRSALPETIRGDAFLRVHGEIQGTRIDAETDYAPQLVADHLVIEGHRVSEWVRHLDDAKRESDPFKRQLSLDKAGHLMYASHKSARDNCGIGSDEADRVVDAVRANEAAGFFGAGLSTLGTHPYVVILARGDAAGRPSEAGLDKILTLAGIERAKRAVLHPSRQSKAAKRVMLSDVLPATRSHLDGCRNVC